MQQTITHLKDLRLNGLLEAWQEQQAQPTYQDLSFDERLGLLVEREYIRRQNQRLRRRLRQAQLFIGACLSEVNFSVPRGLNKAQFLEWAQGKWLSEHLHFIIT
ncbi:MAG: transposase, partial [Cyanothece sp. SIO1E1]|nr:transposase [Cyanothece sp. SIO1E1]